MLFRQDSITAFTILANEIAEDRATERVKSGSVIDDDGGVCDDIISEIVDRPQTNGQWEGGGGSMISPDWVAG